MTLSHKATTAALMALAMASMPLHAAGTDPDGVVERWEATSTYPRIVDINFSDTSWPDTWTKETGRDCPEWTDGGYVNAIIDTRANPDRSVAYPVVFHNCTFATRSSYGGYAGATAAFARQYYLGEKCAGNSVSTYNNWTVAGHREYLEDNIRTDSDGRPVYGEAGFVQMCRNAAIPGPSGANESLHGWVEIDHIPYVDRVQWSWSSTSWGRGIKCDVKIGNGEWRPLVWMGSEKQKQGWTVFSDQGYFMDNKIDARDVSIRWRVWDGEDLANPVQGDGNGGTVFTQAIDPMGQMQAPRVHKIRIYGTELTPDDALYARNNKVSDPGELSDLSQFGGGSDAKPAPDKDAPVVTYIVAKDGSADFTTVQAAIDAVADGNRGLIYIMPGVYEENVYAGRKGDNKFISLIGSDAATTILTSSKGRGDGSATYLECSALNVMTPCFYAENLTIRNTAGAQAGQAEALYTAGDIHVFRNCVISGYQDTFKANTGARGYFKDCLIEGAVDFIYDGGLEWFEDCEIRCRAGRGYITAPGTSAFPMTRVFFPELSEPTFYPGLFFNRCRLTAESGVSAGAYTLGRPWQELGGAAFIDCTMGNHIAASGWTAWNGTEKNASLYEYHSRDNSGALLDVSRRASFSHQATDAEAEAYFNAAFMLGRGETEMDPEARIAVPASPEGFETYGDRLIWQPVTGAAAYIVWRDGKIHAMTTRTSLDSFDADASYSVAAVSRYGATGLPADVKTTVRLKAFPTAEGFGKYTSGGRGGKVVKVTSLADDGSEGTLRHAFSRYPGEPITIVFEVSGQIALNSELRVNRKDWTLAGQTAPGEGIAITRNKVNLGGSENFIVRNVRFRIGRKSVDGTIMAENACGAENCANFIFDHCSFGWSVEENMNTADSHFLTVQHCIVHEGLYNAGHSKGARGYGCQWGGSPATYHHNLLAHNNSRSCRFNGARGEDQVVFIEYANNVNYNYGGEGGCYGGENTAAIASYNGLNSAHECNFMNNYYRRGPASSTSRCVFVNSSYAREGATSWGPAKWYVDGNVSHDFTTVTANNWRGMSAEQYTNSQIRSAERITPALAYYKYTLAGTVGNYEPLAFMLDNIESAADAYASVTAHAGTVNRDKVEARVAREAAEGSVTYGGKTKGSRSGILDKEDDAEGFFDYASDYETAPDTDGDGMPDAWEKVHGLKPDVTDNNVTNRDGYTALEVYLASLMGEEMDTNFGSGSVAVVGCDTELSYDRAGGVLTTDPAMNGALLSVYRLDGTLADSMIITSTSISLSHLPAGVMVVRVDGRNIAPRVIKIVK